MALNSLQCADVPLRNYSLTHSQTACVVAPLSLKPRLPCRDFNGLE